MRITNQMLANQLKSIVSKTSNSQSGGQPLKVGTEFAAKIVNIFNNTLTLELSPGKYLEALDTSATTYKEGEVAEFVVTENKSDGQVLIKALTPEVLELLETKDLETIIAKTNIAPTKENLEVVKELMTNKIPITSENLKLIIDAKNHFEKAGNLVENKNLQLTEDKINKEVKAVLIEHIKNESQSMSKNNGEQVTIKSGEGNKETSVENQVKQNTSTLENSEKNLKTEINQTDKTIEKPINENKIGANLNEESVNKTLADKILPDKMLSNKTLPTQALLNKSENAELNPEKIQQQSESKNPAEPARDKPLTQEATKELVDIVKQLNPEKLVFLLKNQMDFSLNNLKQMENLLLGKQKLTGQIKELITKLETENPKSEDIKSLKLAIKGLELTDISDKSKVNTGLKNISDALDKVNQGETAKAGSEGIRNQLTEVKNSVDFLNKLNDQMTFLQIPVQLNEQSKNIDIFIQRDNSGKRKINPKDTKVFISLDTNHLQLIQVLIEIKDTNINLNFRIENEQVENLLKNNDELLLPSMNTLGFNSVKFNYAVSDKKMDLTNMVRLESVDTVNKIDVKV